MSIRAELESRLLNWAAARVPSVPVALENVPFTKPTGAYVAIYLLGTARNVRNLATGTRATGSFQVDCFTPLTVGMGDVESMVAEIVALYPVLPKVGTVSIESPLDSTQAYVADNYICITLTGRYRVEV